MDTKSHCPISLPSFAELLLSIGSPSVRPLSLLGDPSSSTASHIRETAQGFCKNKGNTHAHGESYRHSKTISILPDNVLLEIFAFCRKELGYIVAGWQWTLLVHVCRRWRQIVFESPLRLNIRILCVPRTPVRGNLNIWPAFPIVVNYQYAWGGITADDEDNVIAALEQPDRLYDVRLRVRGSQLENMATVMQEPLPVLTYLNIISEDRNTPALSGGFLGGSAPSLRTIILEGIPFPALPTLLLSTTNLVTLALHRLPPTGYIPPKVMVACLVTLSSLRIFYIEFQSATPRPDRIRPPPLTRSVLPTLTDFGFTGASEYLEDLVSLIDGPQLKGIHINYLNQLIDRQVTQLTGFIDRSLGLELILSRHAKVTFSTGNVTFDVDRHVNSPYWDWCPVEAIISCEGIDWQVSHMAQVLDHLSTTLPNVVHLKLVADLEEHLQSEDTDDTEWVHLLQQISTVRTLHVSEELAGHVALALEDITEMATEVLPSLDLIYLAGQPASCIEKFVAARQLSGRPVTVIDAETEFDERLKSYVSE